ncbi:hypothetical protein ACSYDW_15370 [Paeniglutamicibacter sp. R2-26]|uniref:hypothetical protein n=1 Tax=Paeniglutamicibacter sp. R2-26 TaxID=3144417 RepID=UPI003EE4B939
MGSIVVVRLFAISFAVDFLAHRMASQDAQISLGPKHHTQTCAHAAPDLVSDVARAFTKIKVTGLTRHYPVLENHGRISQQSESSAIFHLRYSDSPVQHADAEFLHRNNAEPDFFAKKACLVFRTGKNSDVQSKSPCLTIDLDPGNQEVLGPCLSRSFRRKRVAIRLGNNLPGNGKPSINISPAIDRNGHL